MSNQEIRETLEKQLQLLSERSAGLSPDGDLPRLTEAMISLASFLRSSD